MKFHPMTFQFTSLLHSDHRNQSVQDSSRKSETFNNEVHSPPLLSLVKGGASIRSLCSAQADFASKTQSRARYKAKLSSSSLVLCILLIAQDELG